MIQHSEAWKNSLAQKPRQGKIETRLKDCKGLLKSSEESLMKLGELVQGGGTEKCQSGRWSLGVGSLLVGLY